MPPKKTVELDLRPRRPRGRPGPELVMELEALLITVARKLFFQEGYGASTMDAVAKAARVSKTTLYSRFPTKQALFRAVVQAQMASWENGVNAAPVGFKATLEDTLIAYCEVWLRAGMSDDFVQMSRLTYSESQRFPEIGEAAQASARRGVDSLAEVIAHFAQRDEVPCKDPVAAAEVLQMTLVGWFHCAIAADTPVKLQAGRAWVKNAIRLFVASRALW